MNEVCTSCWNTGMIIFLCIVWLFFIFLIIQLASEWEFGEWISDWVKSLIRKLPHPKK